MSAIAKLCHLYLKTVVEFRSRRQKIAEICTRRAQSSRLSYREAYDLLNTRLLAQQIKYGLYVSQFTAKICKILSILINQTFLPLLHIHWKMPRAV